MNIYKISQDIHTTYETYDSAIVIAENEEKARLTHPCDGEVFDSDGVWTSWVTKGQIDSIKVEFIGTTDKESGVVLASYNAG